MAQRCQAYRWCCIHCLGISAGKCKKAPEICFLWFVFFFSFSFKGYFSAARSPQASAQDLALTAAVSTYQHLGRWDIISSSAILLAHPSFWHATTVVSLSLLLPRTSQPQSCFKPGYLEAEVTVSTLPKTLGMCVCARASWRVLAFRGIIFGLTAPHTLWQQPLSRRWEIGSLARCATHVQWTRREESVFLYTCNACLCIEEYEGGSGWCWAVGWW